MSSSVLSYIFLKRRIQTENSHRISPWYCFSKELWYSRGFQIIKKCMGKTMRSTETTALLYALFLYTDSNLLQTVSMGNHWKNYTAKGNPEPPEPSSVWDTSRAVNLYHQKWNWKNPPKQQKKTFYYITWFIPSLMICFFAFYAIVFKKPSKNSMHAGDQMTAENEWTLHATSNRIFR